MKRLITTAVALALAAGIGWAARSQEKPEMPKPAKEHEFLKKFEGTWEARMSMRHAPDQPWVDARGTEQARMIGDFWVVSEWKSDPSEMPMQGLSTTGYDPIKKKYVVTWIGNMSPALSVGDGKVDGKVMTTEVKSTDCQTGKPLEMKMTQEFKDKDTLVWSMTMKDKDGKEFECMKGESKRKK
jgi:hypothetical protein